MNNVSFHSQCFCNLQRFLLCVNHFFLWEKNDSLNVVFVYSHKALSLSRALSLCKKFKSTMKVLHTIIDLSINAFFCKHMHTRWQSRLLFGFKALIRLDHSRINDVILRFVQKKNASVWKSETPCLFLREHERLGGFQRRKGVYALFWVVCQAIFPPVKLA